VKQRGVGEVKQGESRVMESSREDTGKNEKDDARRSEGNDTTRSKKVEAGGSGGLIQSEGSDEGRSDENKSEINECSDAERSEQIAAVRGEKSETEKSKESNAN
jgi:hypothetical protein